LSTQEDSIPDRDSSSKTIGLVQGYAWYYIFKFKVSCLRVVNVLDNAKEVNL
jgi:hypothetical protein